MTKASKKRQQWIEHLLNHAQQQLSARAFKQLQPFLQHYFANTAPDDLAILTPADAFQLAYQHWRFAQTRARNKTLLRVYNPEYCSSHSVIEIITDNRPFLIDSISMALSQQDWLANIIIHPVFVVERDREGQLKKLKAPELHQAERNSRRESFLYWQIDREPDTERLQALEKQLTAVLSDVQQAVNDWQKIRQRLQAVGDELEQDVPSVAAQQLLEVQAFLGWLDQKNFTFLGYQQYKVVKQGQQRVLRPVSGTALGVLRQKPRDYFANCDRILPAAAQQRSASDDVLLISKSVHRSTVHRPGHMDYIAVRQFDQHGHISGEYCFLGLYTSMAYRRHPKDVPIIRDRIKRVFARSKFDPLSHSGKAFLHILETFPRDDLFQISDDDLFDIAHGILHLGERRRLKLFLREDPLQRFISCYVYVSRDRYDTQLRKSVSSILQQHLQALDISFNVKLTDESFARVEYFVRTDADNFPDYDTEQIEQALLIASQSWQDLLKHTLLAVMPEQDCPSLLREYQAAFSSAYQESFATRYLIKDIQILQQLSAAQPLGVFLYRAEPAADPKVANTAIDAAAENTALRLRLYHYRQPIAPSDSLPILENMGIRVLKETPYRISPGNGEILWLHDYALQTTTNLSELERLQPIFEQILSQVWQRRIENDGFNALGLYAGLDCRKITLLRAYCKYLLQAGLPFSQAYMEQCLIKHSAISQRLSDLFELRFNPSEQKTKRQQQTLEKQITTALDSIASLDEDRILRNFFSAILATQRTNAYQTNADQQTKPYIALKLDPQQLLELPEPKPAHEIFVYSPRTEGVHLRSSKVARGGLRWSDRREDFRTEVLGLVKAQRVKNAVIIPTGAKGGFVAKQLPLSGDRDAVQQEVIACYRQFISGLLDITDNLQETKRTTKLQPPANVICYDSDDPYLVVAADKGTATFSDIANDLAKDYGFWLGDAFASGGSLGYDHKKMGITARGAWESVKLLFRDLGKNIQRQDFTVVGIGDMAGDVFGNGMLLSKHIRLIGAFNHLHIFLDPNPDAASSYKERQRLFNLPRSSWEDYNAKLISKGGGVYSRTAKAINLSATARQCLATDKTTVTPNELIQLLLTAPVDLLWNGGIGTYVKATQQQHSAVGDRSNDALRVNAAQLRCRVVGEGGNLGLTQQARIEFALHGGHVDSDFIHNAGGVDCSDHEVNIKILLNQALSKDLLNAKQRAKLLLSMTDDVADLVLQSNYWQGQAITLIAAEAVDFLDEHTRYMRSLETAGQLDRQLEDLPDDEALLERKADGNGLTRPEIAVLLSYSKLLAKAELVDSELWEDQHFTAQLLQYFPQPVIKKFPDLIQTHPLRKDILANQVVNCMLNRMGFSFIYRLQDETGASVADISRAHLIAWEVFELSSIWQQIADLDNQIPAQLQIDMLLETVRLAQRASKWLLQHRQRIMDINAAIREYQPCAVTLTEQLPTILAQLPATASTANADAWVAQGVPESLASRIAGMDALYSVFDIADISQHMRLPVAVVIEGYFGLAIELEILWLRIKMRDYPADNHWQELARKSHIEELYRVLRNLTAEVLKIKAGGKPIAQQRRNKWRQQHHAAIDRCLRVVHDLKAVEHIDLAMCSVALRELQNLYQASCMN